MTERTGHKVDLIEEMTEAEEMIVVVVETEAVAEDKAAEVVVIAEAAHREEEGKANVQMRECANVQMF